ncbi:hypothetical protein V8C37DRAFT_416340 [Trichoderma ceciliae]
MPPAHLNLDAVPTTISTTARTTIQGAFDDLKNLVSSAENRDFTATTLENVRMAARDVERQLAARQKSSNMRRLEPLFEGLHHYSKTIEVLCNGTPYLPWIWAPIKLVLQVASDHIDAFRIIIDAYAQIAESLPRFSILAESLKSSPGFQETLAVFYADILRFHGEAYELVRRSILPGVDSADDSKGLSVICRDMRPFVDSAANAYNIHEANFERQEARKWREFSLREIAQQEKEESMAQFRAILSWLEMKSTEQEDIFDNHFNEADQYQGTCDWIIKHPKISAWLRNQPDQQFIWVKGKPGAGKSVLLTKVVRSLVEDKKSILIHHFCSHLYEESTKYGTIIKSLLAQILRRNDDILAYVYENYVLGRKAASPQALEQLLPVLLPAVSTGPSRMSYVRLILDGLDECDDEKQQRVVALLDRIVTSCNKSKKIVCKVLISSQDSPKFSKLLRAKSLVSLYEETKELMSAIGVYARQRLEEMRSDVFPLGHTDTDVEDIARAIVTNADGMFLWARLVLDAIRVGIFFGAEEIRSSAIYSIPRDLEQFYQRILDRTLTRFGGQSVERMKAVWDWVALSQRPLKKFELKSALLFGTIQPNPAQLPPDQIFELFKPLIEERKDSTLAFVHISVKNYLQSAASGPFVRQPQAFYEQSIACISCLLSGVQVFQNEYDNQDRLRRVVQGFHGFHLYATEYWVQHLFAAAASSEAGLEGNTALLRLTESLCHLLESRSASPETTERTFYTQELRLNNNLSMLERHQTIYKYVKFELMCRQSVLTSRTLPSGNDHTGRDHRELSPLTSTLRKFQDSVKLLLRMRSFSDVSPAEFERFKVDFRTSVYTCKFPGCSRATVGFEDDHSRAEHERGHGEMLRCTVPGCGYDIALRTSKALKSHLSKHHPAAVESAKPRRTLRRTKGSVTGPSQKTKDNNASGQRHGSSGLIVD